MMKRYNHEPLLAFDIVIPLEIWWLILSHLRVRDLFGASLTVCKLWMNALYRDCTEIQERIRIERSSQVLNYVPNLRTLSIYIPNKETTDMLSSLSCLTDLSCYGCFALPVNIDNLTRLVVNRNDRLHNKDLARLTSLKKLTLSQCDHVEGHALKDLTRLEELKLNTRPLNQDTLGYLTNLSRLEIMRTDAFLDHSIKRLTKLAKLVLCCKFRPLIESPETLLSLPSLTSLSMNNQVSGLDMALLTGLKYLKLYGTATPQQVEGSFIESLTNLITLKTKSICIGNALLTRLPNLRSIRSTDMVIRGDITLPYTSSVRDMSASRRFYRFDVTRK